MKFLLGLVLSVLVATAAHAGCATNANDGRVYCGQGDCAVNRNDGNVYCSRYIGGGAAVNHKDGRVYCGTGGGDSSHTVNTDNCVLAR